MYIKHVISAIDSHTEGQNTRVIIGGIPHLKGQVMADKRDNFKQRFDHIRSALMDEPRGWSGMFGACITEPVTEGADFGVIFMDPGGYISGCVHGSIGVATVAVEIGLVELVEPETVVNIDTVSGLVTARVRVEDGYVKSTTLENVPSFVYLRDVQISIPGYKTIMADISFGGNFFVLIDAEKTGCKMTPENGATLVEIGMKAIYAANEQFSVQHPYIKNINRIDLAEFTGYPNCAQAKVKTAAICCYGAPTGAYDRSPCGTGSSAKLALEYAKGNIKVGEEFITESLIGSFYKTKIKRIEKVGNYEAVVPEITGRAYVSGFQYFVIDRRDPFYHGLNLKTKRGCCN